MSIKLGRNDPCHCGSGKKYKRCHLAEDEARERQAGPAATPEESEREAEGAAEPALNAAPSWSKRLGGRQSPRGAKGGKGVDPAELELGKALAAGTPKIAQAMNALEEYQAKFQRILEQDDAFEELLGRVVKDPRCQALGFTDEEVREEMDRRSRGPIDNPEAAWKRVDEAVGRLVNSRRRASTGARLMLLIPDFVAENRHLEACMVEYLAAWMNDPSEGDPFFTAMFMTKAREIVTSGEDPMNRLLSHAGVAPEEVEMLKKLGPEEAFAWVQAHVSAEKLQLFFEDNPDMASRMQAATMNLVEDAKDLFDQPDFDELLVGPEEMEPHLDRFIPAWEAAIKATEHAEGDASKQLFDLLFPTVKEISVNLFTPERLGELARSIEVYKAKKLAAGETSAAYAAGAAILYVRDEQEPDLNPFLLRLAFQSIEAAWRAAAGETDPDEPEDDAATGPEDHNPDR